MDTKNLSLLFRTSLLAAAMSMVVGCSDNPVPAPVESGSIVTVADGLATDCTVKSGTATGAEINKTDNPGQYLFVTDPTDSITAENCVDAHTGVSLPAMKTAKPSATSAGYDEIVITPITTLIQNFIESDTTGATDITAAKAKASKLLGVNVEDLEKNPIAEAAKTDGTGNADLVKAAVKLTAMAKALEKSGSKDPMKDFADALKDKDLTLNEALSDADVGNSLKAKGADDATLLAVNNINTSIDKQAEGKSLDTLVDSIAVIVIAVNDAASNNELSTETKINDSAQTKTSKLKEAGKILKEVDTTSTTFKEVEKKITVSGAVAGS